jgi:CheY-like chemotaxis protein
MHKNLKVLVVHRHVSVANEIKEQFDRAGWLVHLAHSGLDGLLTARKESFGLILSVIDLPVITGIEMMRAIRNFSCNVNTPAVFIDQSTEEDLNRILEKLRVKLHFSEPLDLSQITKMFDKERVSDNSLRVEPLDDPSQS